MGKVAAPGTRRLNHDRLKLLSMLELVSARALAAAAAVRKIEPGVSGPGGITREQVLLRVVICDLGALELEMCKARPGAGLVRSK